MIRIAVTEKEYDKARDVFENNAPPGMECLRAPDPEAELAEFVRAEGIKHAIVGVSPYQDALYGALGRGAVLARFGIGHDGIDKAKATAYGVLCTNTPGALDDSVAEVAIGLVLSAARHIPVAAAETRGGGWRAWVGGELLGKRLAVVGCGRIGRRVAQIAYYGFGMSVAGCDAIQLDAEQLRKECGIELFSTDFSEAVQNADYVSLHIPSMPETRHFINAARLEAMPGKSWLVNTARGAVVSENDLYDGLAAGKIAGAALDVFESEPYAPVSPDKDLRKLDNVIMTPHIGSSTVEACTRMAERALQNIAAGERADYENMELLNRDVLKTLENV